MLNILRIIMAAIFGASLIFIVIIVVAFVIFTIYALFFGVGSRNDQKLAKELDQYLVDLFQSKQ